MLVMLLRAIIIIMNVKPKFFQKHPILGDVCSLILFVVCLTVGVMTLNKFIMRSYNVVGISMENTLHGSDRVIVNLLPVTWAHLNEREFVPERGQIIVFANGPASGKLTCAAQTGSSDQYLIKRVIAFPGERVTVKDGVLTVYNDENPDGFHPDELTRTSESDGPKTHTSGEVDMIVPDGELFVSGDNREGTHSYDSRNGLGTIPFCRVVGPVAIRLYPFDKIRLF